MRVLIVCQYYWPENFRINEIASSLAERGLDIEVLTGKPNYPAGKCFDGYRAWGCQREVVQGITINRVPLFPRGDGGMRLALNYLSFIFSGLIFAPLMLRHKRYDLIFVYGLSPILQTIPAICLGWIKKCPIILWIQDLWPESLSASGQVTNKLAISIVKSAVKFIYRKVDLLLVQSKEFIPRVKTLAGETPIIYQPNSFIEAPIAPTGLNLSATDINDQFQIFFGGNLGIAQALGVIVNVAELLAEIPKIQFVIVGDGVRSEWMQREVKKRNLKNITFLGQKPIEEMPRLMSRASVLLATLNDQEIFGLTIPSKIQAYLAAGRPIIACLNGAGASLVQDAQAGIAVPAEDSHKLAQAIMRLYEMSEAERVALGTNGRKYFEKNFLHENLITDLLYRIEETVSLCRRGNV